MAKLLLLDDDRHARAAIAETLERDGYDVVVAATLSDAAAQIAEGLIDVVLVDLGAAFVRVAEILADWRRRAPETAVILFSQYGSIDAAKDATRTGAFDYLVKPLAIDGVRQSAERAIRSQSLRTDSRPACTVATAWATASAVTSRCSAFLTSSTPSPTAEPTS
ncbi:MAG: response regulator [Tepidisphaeraceae bacterium]